MILNLCMSHISTQPHNLSAFNSKCEVHGQNICQKVYGAQVIFADPACRLEAAVCEDNLKPTLISMLAFHLTCNLTYSIWHVFCYSISHILAGILSGILSDILFGILSDILSDILYLAFFLTFYLACFLLFYLTHSGWHSI